MVSVVYLSAKIHLNQTWPESFTKNLHHAIKRAMNDPTDFVLTL